ncbi:MAG: HigA family addiction module antidote protein [Leptospiraceae bacterium]|nr:HigA family addiction module antidote protein [Leptospiraceae bacterium]MCB1199242.1 HigA family addiction module antidote protein [Leptospiraceae bacterium]
MKRLKNIHPGEILREEFMIPLQITSYRLAKETNIQATRISQILHEKRSISPDTALRLSKFFGNSPDFWLGIQMEYELREQKSKIEKELNEIKTLDIA